jgi:succinoglycan biosynthesis protein ExoA
MSQQPDGPGPAPDRAARPGSAAAVPLLTGSAEPVSVVMPARNEEPYLAESVRSVLSQDYDGELELVIAVGPSRDRTAELARDLAAADRRISVVDNPTGKIATAINLAFRSSRHPVVVRVDGHSMLPPGYIRTALQTLRETGAANVGGIMAAEGITPFQQAVAWAMTSPYGVGAARNHTGGEPGPADTAYLGVFRREAVEQAGGYNEKFEIAEDWELNHRIRQAGGLIWFQPSLRVTYRPRTTVRALGIQYFRYGRWRRVVARQHAGTINLRYLAPPLAAAAMSTGTVAGLAGVSALAAGATGIWPALLTAGFAVPLGYLAAVTLVSIRAARQVSPAAAARLPLVLATMHMTWGTGFLTSPRRLVPDAVPRRARPAA